MTFLMNELVQLFVYHPNSQLPPPPPPPPGVKSCFESDKVMSDARELAAIAKRRASMHNFSTGEVEVFAEVRARCSKILRPGGFLLSGEQLLTAPISMVTATTFLQKTLLRFIG